jgi:hypothetical protein
MPGALGDLPTSVTTKLLLLGDSGTGKTGALASLILAGYNLRILDFDNGTSILIGVLRKKLLEKAITQQQFDDALQRTRRIPCEDRFHNVQGKMLPQSATAWPRACNAIHNWDDGGMKLGNLGTWGEKDILVIDSLTFAGKSAVRMMQQMNSRLAVPPWQSDYGEAQKLVENLCALLYSTEVKCNVVVISHIREVGRRYQTLDDKSRVVTLEEEGTRKGYAETGTGVALSPTIGRYFGAVLLADIVGSGQSTRRVIRTVPHENIGLKNPAPGLVKPEYPLDTGLADYFAAVRGL